MRYDREMRQTVAIVVALAACGTSSVEPPSRLCDPLLAPAGEHQGDFCQPSCNAAGQRFGSASQSCTAHVDLPSGNHIAVTCCAGSGCPAPYAPLFSSMPSGSNSWVPALGCCVFDLNEDTGAPYHWYYARCDGQ